MKLLIVGVIGYPGSGKTYFSERIAKHLHLLHLNSDKARQGLKDKYFNKSEPSNLAVYSYMNRETELNMTRGISVIYDSNSNTFYQRKKFKQFANKFSATSVIVYITTPLVIAKDRAFKRVSREKNKCIYKRFNRNNLYYHLASNLQPPHKSEFKIEICGTIPFKDQLEIFLSSLNSHGIN